ncbi:MAG: hypothetical protein V3S64_07975 [bacterium]
MVFSRVNFSGAKVIYDPKRIDSARIVAAVNTTPFRASLVSDAPHPPGKKKSGAS